MWNDFFSEIWLQKVFLYYLILITWLLRSTALRRFLTSIEFLKLLQWLLPLYITRMRHLCWRCLLNVQAHYSHLSSIACPWGNFTNLFLMSYCVVLAGDSRNFQIELLLLSLTCCNLFVLSFANNRLPPTAKIPMPWRAGWAHSSYEFRNIGNVRTVLSGPGL